MSWDSATHARPAFTLIELIIVMAILVGLAGIVFVSLDPQKRLEQARESQIEQNADQLTKAINLQIVDKFAIPYALGFSDKRDICVPGYEPPPPPLGEESVCINLDQLAEDGYIAAIPINPDYADSTTISGYEIIREGGYVEICPKGRCTTSAAEGSGELQFTVVPNQATSEGSELPITDIGQFNTVDTPITAYAYTIDWGDGTSQDGGASTVDSPEAGSFDGNHTYADDGSYLVTVTLFHESNQVGQDTFTVTAQNVAPVLTVVADSAKGVGNEFTITDIGTFADPGFDNPLNDGGEIEEHFTYSIDWGDGTSQAPVPVTIDVPGSPGVLTSGSFDGTHQYLDSDVYTVTVTITDDDGGQDAKTFQIQTIFVPPL